MAELLVDSGVDVYGKRTWGGITPLDWAISRDNPSVADLLRVNGGKAGEDLKSKDLK